MNETHDHFLFACTNTKAVWRPFQTIFRLLQTRPPANPLELFFDTPPPQDQTLRRGYSYIWPIIRATVYYSIWLDRNNRTFRPDLPFKTPLQVSIQAAIMTRLHISRLFQIPDQKKKPKQLRGVLSILSSNHWLKEFLIPGSLILRPDIPLDNTPEDMSDRVSTPISLPPEEHATTPPTNNDSDISHGHQLPTESPSKRTPQSPHLMPRQMV
ncbi:hypothetical protein DAPPUDRAFT_342942 [Daphnia pulex]|uniref:Reverse transcriptase zinc-binding domain-containing protein n=1 Tax=Daphnia pulex TaxID=6669 RepID=E9I660_DAPPU|nr:hypothetical protein DAPPUDRAFT_342942 [Daphnia pulex]|eukprot:EFX60520.1 hypothetical protein DAPPUDRAFT_342942 [Daphnia pulex]